MAINYSVADNKITITGYSVGTPCNFTNLWTEDKAGTLDLWTGTPAINITLTTQIKPSDELALKIDFVLAGSGAGAGDTIDITGTDKDGNAQLETLITEADGTFTTTKWFKTITDIDCNGFNSGTLIVRQNQWGVVWKGDIFYDDNFYKIDCKIHLGDANNDAHFGDKDKVVLFMADWVPIITSEAGKGHIYLGERGDVSEKTGKNGCIFKANVYMGAIIKDPAGLFCYDSVFSNDAPWTGFSSIDLNGASGEIWNSRFNNVDIKGSANNMDLYGITISDSVDVGFGDFSTNGIMYNISVYECKTLFEVYPGGVINIKNVIGKHIYDYLGLFFQDNAESHYAINWDVSWNPNDYLNDLFYWSGACPDAILYRQYSFNLKIIDENGSGEDTVRVVMYDKDGNITNQKGFDTTTNASGEIVEQTVSYGYYNQAGGNTISLYSPHTMKLYKYGKQMSKSKSHLSATIDWTLTMYDNDYITEAVEATVAAYTGIDINHTTGTITISENHTMAEIYDYLQYDIKENPQLAIDETIETADGVNFTSQYNFVVNTGITVTATDKKLTMITGKTYTLTGTANFTGIIADDTKTRVPVVLKSVIDGSRYRIEKTSDGTMVFEGTQSGAGDIINYYEHTANLGVKVKVRKSDPAGTRYYPVETTGSITDTGFNLTISQKEDGQANGDASSGQISLNAGTKIISITTPKTEATIQELLNAIRDWEDELTSLEHAGVIDTEGNADLGGGVETGIVITLNILWQVQFYGGSGYTKITGGTLVGGVGSEPVKATGTAGDLTIQIQPTDATITTANTDALETGINDIKGTGFVKDTHSLTNIVKDYLKKILWRSN